MPCPWAKHGHKKIFNEKKEKRKMNRAELIKAASKESGFTQADMTRALDAFETVLVNAVHEGDEVKLFQGVSFKGEYKPEGTARNPKTGEVVKTEAKMTCKVKLTSTFKNKIA